jgi:hypothetical protein
MKQNKTKIQENQFRALVRNEIAKIIREEEEMGNGDNQEAPKEEKPKEDRSDTLEKVTYAFTKSLKNNLQTLSADEMSDVFDSIMGHFGLGKDSKMEVLRSIKNKIQA